MSADSYLPQWLNKDLVQRVFNLIYEGYDNIVVSDIDRWCMSKPEDYHCSILCRVAAKTPVGVKFLIAKTLPVDEDMCELAVQGRMFHREVTMVAEIIPELQKTLQEAADPDFTPLLEYPFAPPCLHYEHHPETFIFLDDLSVEGFRHADRQRGLDLAHSLLALRTLGLFHAATAIYLKTKPGALTVLGNPYDLLKLTFNETVQETFPQAAMRCRQWVGFEGIADAIETSRSDMAEKLAQCHAHEGEFNVICHGEFWMNNLMFKYDGDDVKEVRFLDFQMSHVTSPAADLLYFLTSSVHKEVFREKWSLLLHTYHEALTNAMEAFDMQAPTLEGIEEMLNQNGPIAVYATLVISPMAKAPPGDFDNGYLYSTDDVKDWLKPMIEELAVKGWLSVPGFRSTDTD